MSDDFLDLPDEDDFLDIAAPSSELVPLTEDLEEFDDDESHLDENFEGNLITNQERKAMKEQHEEKIEEAITNEPKFHTARDRRVYQFCLLGATNKDLCKMLNISTATFHRWRKKKKRFAKAIRLGKEQADAMVVESLFKRATGYVHKDTKFATFMGDITDEREYDKHYAPDVGAITMWLTNRTDNWHSTQRTELTGKNGAPLQTMNANIDLTKMSNIEKASRLISIMQKAVKEGEQHGNDK